MATRETPEPKAGDAQALKGSGAAGKKPSRRLILIGGLAAGGGLAIGAALMPFSRLAEQRALLAKTGETPLLGALRIAEDDTLTVIIPHADMGVGNGTALAQMLAEELDADWKNVKIERAPAELAFANARLGQAYLRGDVEIPPPLAGAAALTTRRIAEVLNLQITGGSTAVRLTGREGMRYAGAAARHMLIKAAAKSWNAPESAVSIANGRLIGPNGQSAGFGAMAKAALAFDPPAAFSYKAPSEYRISGQSKQRFDIPAKVTGSALYSPDLRLDAMVFAALQPCPVRGGLLKSVDAAPARAMRGVIDVVELKDAVAVLADSHWRAIRAAAALTPAWDFGPQAGLDSAATLGAMRAGVEGERLTKDYAFGNADKIIGETSADAVVERRYSVPYLAHAAMEPVGCVAQLKEGRLHIWGAFQDALGAQARAMEVAGLPRENVKIHHTEMGGAFGRRGPGSLDYLDHAIEIAQKTDRPVNLLYTRENDMQRDFYRNASAARMRAVLGADGRPTALSHRFAEKEDPKEATRMPYAIPAIEARYVKDLNQAPWGAWRSVDHSYQGFFIESFIDELATEAGQDPLAYRRALLADDPRARAVLDAAGEMANWTTPRGGEPGKRIGLGVALVESFETIVAEVAEVEVSDDGAVRVREVWVAADPGFAVNPNGFIQQMESGVIYGLSAALYEKITFKNGAVQEANFPDYPVVTMADCPKISCRIINSGLPTGGAGEPATPPIAAAVTNAIFAATGARVRDLPISDAKLARTTAPA